MRGVRVLRGLGLWFGVWGLGFRVSGFGFRVSGFGVWGLGFGVWVVFFFFFFLGGGGGGGVWGYLHSYKSCTILQRSVILIFERYGGSGQSQHPKASVSGLEGRFLMAPLFP